MFRNEIHEHFLFSKKNLFYLSVYCTKFKIISSKWNGLYGEIYSGHPWTYPTFRKIAAAAADVKNVQEFVAEKDGRDVGGQHDIDALAENIEFFIKIGADLGNIILFSFFLLNNFCFLLEISF